jgi:hypothetical protein
MKAATIALPALCALIIAVHGCGGSPASGGDLTPAQRNLLRDAGGALARYLAYPPGHPLHVEAPTDSLGRAVAELGRQNPAAWTLFYRAASDTLLLLESPFGENPQGFPTPVAPGGRL